MDFVPKSRLFPAWSVREPPLCLKCGCHIPKCTFDPVPQSFEDALRDKFLIPWDTQVAEEYITTNNPYHVAMPLLAEPSDRIQDASALGSGDHTDSIGKLHDYSVPVVERYGIKTFGVNCLRLDLAGEPPRYLVQVFTTEEDTGR